jgi:hypothetical protein
MGSMETIAPRSLNVERSTFSFLCARLTQTSVIRGSNTHHTAGIRLNGKMNILPWNFLKMNELDQDTYLASEYRTEKNTLNSDLKQGFRLCR